MKVKTFQTRKANSKVASIVGLLEQGKPIKGKFAWIKIADEETYFDEDRITFKTPIYAKVKILGLVQGKNGMVIQAQLTDGIGTLSVDPNQLVSDFREVERMVDVARRQSLCCHQYRKIVNAHFKREQVRRLEEALEKLPTKTRKELQADKADYFTQGEIPKVKASLSSADLGALCRLVCMLTHNLEPDQRPTDYRWRHDD